MINTLVNNTHIPHLKLEFEYSILDIVYLSERVVRVTMAPVNNKKIKFTAGQYIYIEILSNKIVPCSIASSPVKNEIEIIISYKDDDSNVRALLSKYNQQTSLKISAAMGEAYYRETGNNLIALAGGVGIGPIKSIIDYLLINRITKIIDLYHIVNSPQDLFFNTQYVALASNYEEFAYTPIITDKKGLTQLYDILISKYKSFSEVDIYSFGPMGFTNEIFRYLSDFQLGNFLTDNNLCIKVGVK